MPVRWGGGGGWGPRRVWGAARSSDRPRDSTACWGAYTPSASNTWQRTRFSMRTRHTRTQTKSLARARPAARLEVSRSRLPARRPAHPLQRAGNGAIACRTRLAMPRLHDEAEPIKHGHVEEQLVVLDGVAAPEDDRCHGQWNIFSRSCARQSMAVGGQWSAWNGTWPGRQAVFPLGIIAGLTRPRQARWRGRATDRQRGESRRSRREVGTLPSDTLPACSKGDSTKTRAYS